MQFQKQRRTHTDLAATYFKFFRKKIEFGMVQNLGCWNTENVLNNFDVR